MLFCGGGKKIHWPTHPNSLEATAFWHHDLMDKDDDEKDDGCGDKSINQDTFV